ncbi:uracil-DNA glycosylase [Zhihengliuella flava]|uniref:Uracil-DNA glycosylase n=1 Tax=Zhihengliuella flava TaxID=1285193 RepID=A0A931DD20_9MICC|nr:uracil-DNA glycosylase [Zhihengliuella flava]MBG6085226.1 uracil-DNA glycosylase [Zhihengliuella flava]
MDLPADWAAALAPAATDLESVRHAVARRREQGEEVLPAAQHVLRAFSLPVESVRVLIVGQDPYPTPGHAIGFAFAADAHVRPVPRSLANIFSELHDDVGAPPPATGDLTPWADQGVMLLNRVLTVAAGSAGSHRGLGWEAVTDAAITALAQHSAAAGTPLVAILWGRDAQQLRPLLAAGEEAGTTAVIASAHPSPLSARRGFFGSRPFSRANAFLRQHGAREIRWELPAAEAAPGTQPLF